MKNRKYKFSIDEAAPQIPPAADFNAMLLKVKGHVPWYSKFSVLGGAATAVVAGIATWVYVGQQAIEQKFVNPAAQAAVQTPNQSDDDSITSAEISNNPFKKAGAVMYGQEMGQYSDYETPTDSLFGFEFTEPTLVQDFDAPLPMQSIEKRDKATSWNIECPFDTITIDMTQLPARYTLRNFGYLWVQKSSFKDRQGNAATGKIKLLYRDIRDVAAMIVSQTLIEESGATLPINNGAFELQVVGSSIVINEEAPLYLSFLPNQKAKNNQGYKKNAGSQWQILAEAGMGNNTIQEDASGDVVIDSIPSRLNFWQFMVSIFSGKDMHTYDVYAHPEYTKQEGLGKESMESGLRTYEIREFGHYANGWNQSEKKIQQRDVRVKSYHKDAFQPIVYQVFAGENRVRKVIPDSAGSIHLEFTSKDRCYLMIPLKNTQKFAVYDANSFDRVVKYGTQKQIVIRTQSTEIKSLEELRAFMRKYESQKLPSK